MKELTWFVLGLAVAAVAVVYLLSIRPTVTSADFTRTLPQVNVDPAAVQNFVRPSDDIILQVQATEPAPAAPGVVLMEVAAPDPTPTAYFAPATATPQFSPQFLADCALAQGQGRRVHPQCPTNAAEMLGPGR